MTIEIRRTLELVQTTQVEGGRAVSEPTRMFAAMVVIRNPWFGRGFVEDLKPEIREHCPVLGNMLTETLLGLSGGRIEGVGKASVVGMGGEVEHAQALTHSLWFRQSTARGNRCQDLFGVFQYQGCRRLYHNHSADGQGRWRPAVALPDDANRHSRCARR